MLRQVLAMSFSKHKTQLSIKDFTTKFCMFHLLKFFKSIQSYQNENFPHMRVFYLYSSLNLEQKKKVISALSLYRSEYKSIKILSKAIRRPPDVYKFNDALID